MAPVGHTVVQAPQPMHRLGVTSIRPRPSCHCERIAWVEQISMQAVQPVILLRPCAQIFSLYWKNFGFSNSPTIWTRANACECWCSASAPAYR